MVLFFEPFLARPCSSLLILAHFILWSILHQDATQDKPIMSPLGFPKSTTIYYHLSWEVSYACTYIIIHTLFDLISIILYVGLLVWIATVILELGLAPWPLEKWDGFFSSIVNIDDARLLVIFLPVLLGSLNCCNSGETLTQYTSGDSVDMRSHLARFSIRSNVKYTVVFLYPGALFWVRWRAETQYKHLGEQFKAL